MGPALPGFLVASGQRDLWAEWPRFQQVLEFYNPEKATYMVRIPILSFLSGIFSHPEPVTNDDEFSECQNSMFIFQTSR